MTRRQWIGTGAALLGAAALATAVGAGRRALRPAQGPVTLMIQGSPADAPPGVLVIAARAHVAAHAIDFNLCWFCEVRSADLTRTIAAQEYDRQWFAVPAGRTADPTFAERLEMPPGQYNVLIGLREERPTFDRAWNVVQAHSGIVASSRLLTVR